MAEGGELFEDIGVGRPGAGLGLASTWQTHFAKKDVTELFGGTQIEFLAGQLVELVFERRHLLREAAG